MGANYDLILALRSQIFEDLRDFRLVPEIEDLRDFRLVPEIRSSEKKMCFFSPSISDLFEGLWSVGTRFGHNSSRASPRP